MVQHFNVVQAVQKSFYFQEIKATKDIKIKKLCLTSRFETVNISSVGLLLRHNK